MSIESIICPQCGETANIDNEREFGFCSYCGFKIEKPKPVTAPTSAEMPTSDSLITRAELFLEEKNFAKASEYFDKALDINPHASKAYWGLLICKLETMTIQKLKDAPDSIEEFNEYKNAVRFAESEETKQKYINEAARLQTGYFAEKKKTLKKETEVKQIIRIEDLKASIKRLKTVITIVDIIKALHAFASALLVIACLILGIMTLSDFGMIVAMIPVVSTTAFFIGGVIGLDKLGVGLYRINMARMDTLTDLEAEMILAEKEKAEKTE